MTTFNQRNQKVSGDQFNAGGDINFAAVRNKVDVATELQKFLTEVSKATQVGILNAEIAADIEAKVKKTVIQAQKPESDKKTMLAHLTEAKALIEGITAATGLVTVLSQAIEMVRRLF